MVTGLDVADVVADGLDHARRLVSHHHGDGRAEQALHEVQVAVAQPCTLRLYEDFLGSWIVDPQILHLEISGLLAEHRSFHVTPPRVVRPS